MNLRSSLKVCALGAVVAALLGGCTTVRTASFPGKNMDEVFQASIRGLCAESNRYIVYEADRQTGDIKVLTRGFFVGHQFMSVKVAEPAAGNPTATVSFPGISPYPDRILLAITQEVLGQKEGEKAEAEEK